MQPKYQGSNVSRDERPATNLVPKPPRPPGFTDDSEWEGFKGQVQRAHVSALLPKGMTVDQALVIACKGRELNMPPLYALSQLVVINGKAGMQAEGMRALVYRAYPDAHIVVTTPIEKRNEGCIIEVARSKDAPKQYFSFTIDDAVQAGLVARNASGKLQVVSNKYPWVQYPADMLFARATSRAVRAVWPDVVMGCGYTPDELSEPRGTLEVRSRELDQAFSGAEETAALPPAETRAEVLDIDAEHRPVAEHLAEMALQRNAKEPEAKAAEVVEPTPPAEPKTAPQPIVDPQRKTDPGDYVIKYGRLTGKKCSEVSRVSLESYCTYLSGLARPRTGEPDEAVEETVRQIKAYLAQT